LGEKNHPKSYHFLRCLRRKSLVFRFWHHLTNFWGKKREKKKEKKPITKSFAQKSDSNSKEREINNQKN